MVAESTGVSSPKGNKRKKKRLAGSVTLTFDDSYLVTGEVLGQGSFGCVCSYQNQLTKEMCAVKIVYKSKRNSRAKVFKEIEIYHRCRNHRNIVQLLEFFEEDARFCLVFERIGGGTLDENITERGMLPEDVAQPVVSDIANALLYLHGQGIAHRDIKPENMLCFRRDQLSPVKVCDFDLASELQESLAENRVLWHAVGSPQFMAPEVIDTWMEPGRSYDKCCDLWSLGVVMYFMLCGYLPFQHKSVSNGSDCNSSGTRSVKYQDSLFACIRNAEYSFPSADWSLISNEAKSLIRNLLVINPSGRFTAKKVLQDHWLRSCCDNTTTQPNHGDELRVVSPHHSVPSGSAGDTTTPSINLSPQASDAICCLPNSDHGPDLMENEAPATGAALEWSDEKVMPLSVEPVAASAHIDSLDSGFASA